MIKSRWVMVIVAACLVVTAAAVAYAVGKANTHIIVADVVRAKRFDLMDENNNLRADFLVLNGKAPTLIMFDKGQVRAGMAVQADGNAELSLMDKAGKQRAIMAVKPDGSPELRLLDEKGKVLWHAP